MSNKLFLSAAEVTEKTGLSRTSIWRKERRGEFPARRQLSANRVGWLCSEVEEWAATRPPATGRPDMAAPAARVSRRGSA